MAIAIEILFTNMERATVMPREECNPKWYFTYNPKICPCKDCTERNAECHGKCKKYENWKETKK